MVVTTPSTITPPPTCDNHKAKKVHFGAYLTRLWPWHFDPKIWRIHPCSEVR